MFDLIAGIAGAAIGGISSILGGNKQAAAYEEQKRNAWKQYLINKEFGDTQFWINKNESLKSLDVQRRRLGEDLTAGMDSFNTGLLGQAYGIQDARIGLASQLGAYDAAQGASGTRGNETSGLVKAYAQNSFDRNVALQSEQNSQALSGMVTQADRASADIMRERDSWGLGGYRTQLKSAEDERNRKLAELGQQQLQYAADQAKPGIFDVLTGGLSGASMGIGLGSSIDDALKYSSGRGSLTGGLNLVQGPFNLDNPLGLTPNIPNSFNSIGGLDQYRLPGFGLLGGS
jgi:hypothetical protein